MPAPLSMNLRQKIIEVHTEEAISQRQLAERFRVSLSSIQRLLKRFRNDEGLEPRAHGGGHPPIFSSAQLETVRRLVETNNDPTLAELCELVSEQEGETVSVSTLWRIVEGLEITWEKNDSRE